MKKTDPRILILFITCLLLGFIIWEVEHEKLPSPDKEKCLYCHASVTDPSKSHPIDAFGCYKCHLGNPYSADKKSAHTGMVLNPGDLEVVKKTCGKTGCHSEQVDRVRKSLMATNRGIIGTLLRRWENREAPSVDVMCVKANGTGGSMALDLYTKMCAGCHLWQKRRPHEGWPRNRGGGCSACHTPNDFDRLTDTEKVYKHPQISTVIPVKNCLRCHNRSARIGLSYIGVYESSGYGTPFHGSSPTERRLPGRRFYLNLPPDIHWEKHKMLCIDCHTGRGLMGDGNTYDHFNEQVEITCRACHVPVFQGENGRGSLMEKLVSSNGKVQLPGDTLIAYGRKGSPIYNLQKRDSGIWFLLKESGKKIAFKPTDFPKAYHNFRGHERLQCQACHSLWIPQCYGCHYVYTASKKQKDWLWGKKTCGQWKEFRYYIRFETPTLGVDFNNSIMPFSPCQVLVRTRENPGSKLALTGIRHMIMSAFDPHTTSKGSRVCTDCHGNPKSLGLGEGNLYKKRGRWFFESIFNLSRPSFLFDHSLDSFVDLNGNALQVGYRPGARPFSKDELERILRVNLCLDCHKKYEDKIYDNFEANYQRFLNERDLPCKALIGNN